MKAFDFEYDGKNLSTYGFMICNFDSKGLETVSNGAEITFNTVATHNGEKHELTSVQYDKRLETVIQICKNTCGIDEMEISVDEQRLLSRWLNRKGFRKFKILNNEYLNFYFEASFNVKRIEFNGKVFGLELEVKTNRAFALQEVERYEFENTVAGTQYTIEDFSDVEGHIYPKVQIEMKADGDLDIYNEIEDRHTIITGCKNGEVIEMKYPIIKTSDTEHKIQDCFNWNFFRIANSYETSTNLITISMPCVMKVEYAPYVKVGL